MGNSDIEGLKKEIADLRAELAEFRGMVVTQSTDVSKHIVDQYRDIGDIFSYLLPLLRRAYPGLGASNKQIQAILKRQSALGRKRPGAKDSS